jgi:HAE1 family hydrophobic/amphiphilic exporter-1/multidrug efflux pump
MTLISCKKSKFSGHLTWLWIFFRKQRFCASVTKEPGERKLSQEEIADKLTKWTKQYPNAKTSVTQQPTIAVNRRGGLPIQYIIQTQNFSKLEEKIPLFMEAVDNDPTFQCLMNLKFNKPELNVTIDREKSREFRNIGY